jgi:hypothetical protein
VDPRFNDAIAVTETITGQKMSPDPETARKARQDEVRVVLPMSAWDELEYLAADDTEEPTDLPTVLSLEAFYVGGFTVADLLQIMNDAIPDSWTASVVHVPDYAYSGAQIAITRR